MILYFGENLPEVERFKFALGEDIVQMDSINENEMHKSIQYAQDFHTGK